MTAASRLTLPAGTHVAFGVPWDGYRMAVSTVMVRVLVDAVEWAGVSRDELLRPLKIDPARLAEADGRFDPEEFARLQMHAMDLTHDEALGFHIAERTPDSAFDL